MSSRHAAIGALVLLLALGAGLWWLARPTPPKVSPALALHAVAFDALAGWQDDDHAAALGAFQRSCQRFAKWPAEKALGRNGVGGRTGEWRDVCAAAAKPAAKDAKGFFETYFRPYLVTWGGEAEGLFTGYYEASLRGSRRRSDAYNVPLLRRPDDLIEVWLGAFDPKLKGRRIHGRVAGRRLLPYPNRAEIEAETAKRADEALVWVDDPVDAFFLHIQGSGRVALAEGGEMRVGYAAQNGQRYFAIGRELIRRGAMTRETVSMQAIRRWLADNPEEAAAVMQQNPSYIFFRELQGAGPMGALGVPLTPERSIAVDRRLVPLGAPLWLETTRPGEATPYRRLMVAQDTGGAIKGAVRGDVFWGHGPEAADIAGRMKEPGRWYLLLPKTLDSGG